MLSAHAAAPADANAGPAGPAHDGGRHHGPRGPLGFLGRTLNLTDDQKQQIRTIMDNSRTASAPIRAQLKTLHQQVHDAIVANGYQESQVRPLVQAQSQVLVDLAVERIATMAQVRAVLTPAQQQQLEQLRAQRPDGGPEPGPGMGMGMGMGMGLEF
jgi:Spy/CpxP family protein refolding chaperone